MLDRHVTAIRQREGDTAASAGGLYYLISDRLLHEFSKTYVGLIDVNLRHAHALILRIELRRPFNPIGAQSSLSSVSSYIIGYRLQTSGIRILTHTGAIVTGDIL